MTVTLVGVSASTDPFDTIVWFYGFDAQGHEVEVAVDHRPAMDLADALLDGALDVEAEGWQVRRL